jgi:hypothetical protein
MQHSPRPVTSRTGYDMSRQGTATNGTLVPGSDFERQHARIRGKKQGQAYPAHRVRHAEQTHHVRWTPGPGTGHVLAQPHDNKNIPVRIRTVMNGGELNFDDTGIAGNRCFQVSLLDGLEYFGWNEQKMARAMIHSRIPFPIEDILTNQITNLENPAHIQWLMNFLTDHKVKVEVWANYDGKLYLAWCVPPPVYGLTIKIFSFGGHFELMAGPGYRGHGMIRDHVLVPGPQAVSAVEEKMSPDAIALIERQIKQVYDLQDPDLSRALRQSSQIRSGRDPGPEILGPAKVSGLTRHSAKILAETRPPAKIQQETRPPAKVQQETRPSAKVQEETRPPAKVQQETRPLAKVQEETRPPAKVQQETRLPAKVQEETRPPAKVQQETRPPVKVQQETRPSVKVSILARPPVKARDPVPVASQDCHVRRRALDADIAEVRRFMEFCGKTLQELKAGQIVRDPGSTNQNLAHIKQKHSQQQIQIIEQTIENAHTLMIDLKCQLAVVLGPGDSKVVSDLTASLDEGMAGLRIPGKAERSPDNVRDQGLGYRSDPPQTYEEQLNTYRENIKIMEHGIKETKDYMTTCRQMTQATGNIARQFHQEQSSNQRLDVIAQNMFREQVNIMNRTITRVQSLDVALGMQKDIYREQLPDLVSG